GGTAHAAVEEGYFTREVYPVLAKANCKGCHSSNGLASSTRLRFPDNLTSANEIEAFGKSLAGLGPLLLQKPSNRVAHTGGKLIAPGSAEESALAAWIEHLAKLPATASSPE